MMMLSFWSNRESTIGKKTDWPWGSTRQPSMTCQNGFKKRKKPSRILIPPRTTMHRHSTTSMQSRDCIQHHRGPHHQSSRSRATHFAPTAPEHLRRGRNREDVLAEHRSRVGQAYYWIPVHQESCAIRNSGFPHRRGNFAFSSLPSHWESQTGTAWR